MWKLSVPALAALPFLCVASVITSWLPRGLAVRVLVAADMVVPTTHYLNVSDCYLVMQPDCNAILYNQSHPLLWTNDSDTFSPSQLQQGGYEPIINCTPIMQVDGNFVIYATYGNSTFNISNEVAFASDTDTRGDNNSFKYLLLRGDGTYDYFDYTGKRVDYVVPFVPYYAPLNLTAPSPALGPASSNATTVGNTSSSYITYPFPPDLAWKPDKPLDGFPYMPAEYYLSQGSQLQSVAPPGYHQFVLVLGNDCNLQFKEIVMDGSDWVVWETGTNSSEVRNCQLILQQDGLLQIRNNVTGAVYWNTSYTRNVSVAWVLRVSSTAYNIGELSIEDIEDSTNILWIYPNQTNSGNTPSKSSIVGIVVGTVVGASAVAMAGVAFLVYYYAETWILDPAEKAFLKRLEENGGNPQTRYSAAKIKLATNRFDTKLGAGGFGDVFYGKLPEGQEIAAKVLSTESHQSKAEFFNEIELLSVVHHKYLVTLLGYRCTRKQQILVYEYMSGGDLRHRLQGQSAEENPLSWRQRMNIALQVAEGLEYLHDKCFPSIIHRDVKSTNILLTDKLVAKVADFGLSKLRSRDQEEATHVTTIVKGTPGYLDPEYHEKGMLTDKSDVYAFGIVVMEILTGRDQMQIRHTVAEAWRLQQFDGLPDPNLRGEYEKDEFVSVVELSLWCTRRTNAERPFMRQVVQRLRDLGFSPPESSQPEFELGDEGQHVAAFNIGLENFEDDSVSFAKSSSGMNSETKHCKSG